jgi:hypothetical protein
MSKAVPVEQHISILQMGEYRLSGRGSGIDAQAAGISGAINSMDWLTEWRSGRTPTPQTSDLKMIQ